MSYPVKLVKIITPIAFAISLAACGGGEGTTFGSGGGSGGGQQQVEKTSSIELSTSSRQLSSDGSDPVTITAIAKNKDNNAISGAKITFSVDNDATIIPDTATGSVHTATLQPGTPNNRKLTVKVTSDNITKSITVDVVGTSVVIDGPSAITLNKAVPFVLKLKDGADKKISYEAVTLTSSAGNTITTDSNFETDENGEIAFSLIGLQGGSDVLTAEVLGTSISKSITISEDEFELSNNNAAELNINTSQLIKFFWKKSGVPQASKLINISATRGSLASNTVTTNAAGEASIEISSATAGKTVISATTADGLSTSLTREFVATTPAYLNTQADPTLITPNKSSTIISRIRDINDNPVKNKVINFRLDDTVNGVLSGSTAVTDSLGRASISYTAGDSSSAKDGVKITTFVQGYEGVVNEDSIFLTVGSNALRIVLGEDNVIASSDVFYIRKYGVIVTDSAGNPVKEQKVNFTIIPTAYYKGQMVVLGDVWAREEDAQICDSEDLNKNGKLDAGEDINGSDLLEPTHDAAVTGTGVTDDNGRIVIEVVYPKSRALWSVQRITSSVVVNGTEFEENIDFQLPVAASDVKDIKIAPPNQFSPYGITKSCTDKPSETPAPPAPVVAANVVDAVFNNVIDELRVGNWYSVTLNGQPVLDSDFTITTTKAINIETGPNNSFRLSDGDTASDDTGFYLTLNIGGSSLPLFFRDDAAIAPPPPVDSIAPVITLNGASAVTISVGSVYTDAGAIAVDAVDGVITVITTGTGAVNTAVPGGPFTITYQATDSAGNIAIAYRSVTVQ